MTTGSISAASLSENVLASGNSTPLQQALQALQNNLASGNLTGAQSAFQSVQRITQLAAAVSGSSSSTSSQLSTDLTALGSALSSGNLSTAQSAFATVQSDFSSSPSPSQAIETGIATQSEQLVQELLGSVSSSPTSPSTSDSITSVLQAVYGKGSLNVFG
ncbi:MAG: hypothetical protein WBV31_08420 [Terriglobales bacterium]|jgi:type VI protein secretion system component VasK